MKRKIAAIGLVLGALMLSGCGSGTDDVPEGSTPVGNEDSAKRMTIEGVDCIVVSGYRSSAISCDWD